MTEPDDIENQNGFSTRVTYPSRTKVFLKESPYFLGALAMSGSLTWLWSLMSGIPTAVPYLIGVSVGTVFALPSIYHVINPDPISTDYQWTNDPPNQSQQTNRSRSAETEMPNQHQHRPRPTPSLNTRTPHYTTMDNGQIIDAIIKAKENNDSTSTILGLDPHHAPNDINKAFHKLARQTHPDKNPENAAKATEAFQIITEAVSELKGGIER